MLNSPAFAQAVLIFLLFLLAGTLGIVYQLASAARKLIVTSYDARSREEDSPLGVHRADPKAHEPMRDDFIEKIDERLTKLEVYFKAHMDRAQKTTADVLSQNERLIDELTRSVQEHRNCPLPQSQNLVPRRDR